MTRAHLTAALAVAIAILAVGQSCGAGKRADMAEARERAHLTAIAVANHRANEAIARADSLANVTQVRIDTARVTITRWRERTDTLTVPQIIALADTTIAACEAALDGCEQTIAAKDRALELRTAERDAMEDYNAHLRLRVMTPEPWWPTLVTVGVASGVGYAADGLGGAVVGAGIGLGLDIGRRGVVSLHRSIRR
jgi:hypothetical protein